MFGIYLKLAWRNLRSRSFYSLLNISGLAMAIAASILMYCYISYNLNFDRYHAGAERMFRLVFAIRFDKPEYDRGSSYAEYQAVKTQLPGVEQAGFMLERQTLTVNVGQGSGSRFKEDRNVAFTDAEWFKLINHRWIAGNANLLNIPGNVVLREKTARKYFGTTNVIGKTLVVGSNPVMVCGVIADAPYNTDLKADLYFSQNSLRQLIPSYERFFYTDWGYLSSVNVSIIKLRNAVRPQAVEQQLAGLAKQRFGDNAKYYQFMLQPLNQVHFDTRYGATVQKELLVDLAVIGLLIMVVAVINYINIVVAQQVRRGQEIGTRKVLGGSPAQIFMQFITESMLTSAIALVIAVALVAVLLPIANSWLFADDPIHIISYPALAACLLAMLIMIALGTGLYPAWLMSRVNIMQAIKNAVQNGRAGFGRRVLVVFQNTVTQGLIVCTIIMVMQVYYLKNTDIGFNRNMVITIPVGTTTKSQQEQLAQSLKSMPAVRSFSFELNAPASSIMRGATIKYGTRTNWEKWPAQFAIGDSAYHSTNGLKLLAGRNIRGEQAVPEMLINQTMAGMLEAGNPERVIGKALWAGDTKGVIVGIVRDFSLHAMDTQIAPVIVLEQKEQHTNLGIKLTGSHVSATLAQLKDIYQRVLPDQLFTISLWMSR